MPDRWTIKTAGGGRDGIDLVGCHIIKTDEGKYQFAGPFPGDILSTTTGNRLPTPPFDFPPFSWAPPGLGEFTWRINVTTLTAGASHTQAQGTWRNNDPNGNPSPAQDESGTWTAQADATMEDRSEGDAAAASAGGGNNV